MPRRIRTEDVWPDREVEQEAAPQGIEERLRSSAENWRGLASGEGGRGVDSGEAAPRVRRPAGAAGGA